MGIGAMTNRITECNFLLSFVSDLVALGFIAGVLTSGL
jgi:hypothetical protein